MAVWLYKVGQRGVPLARHGLFARNAATTKSILFSPLRRSPGVEPLRAVECPSQSSRVVRRSKSRSRTIQTQLSRLSFAHPLSLLSPARLVLSRRVLLHIGSSLSGSAGLVFKKTRVISGPTRLAWFKTMHIHHIIRLAPAPNSGLYQAGSLYCLDSYLQN